MIGFGGRSGAEMAATEAPEFGITVRRRRPGDRTPEHDLKIALIAILSFLGLTIAGVIVGGPHIQEAVSRFAPRTPPTKVRTEVVKRTRVVETVKAPGKIEPRTKVDISAEVSARIESLPHDEGAFVRKGDLVVKLDDREFGASVASAEARRDGETFRLQSEQSRLTGLLSTLSYAQKQLERKQALYDSGDLARQDLDDALERVDDLQAQIDATKHSISVIESSLAGAKADIDRAREALAKTVIAAPMDGIITARNAEVGEVVLVGTMNNPGTVIITIADLSRMLMKAEVSESDIAKVQNGQTARVHINAYRDEVFSGTVTHVALQRTEKLDGTGHFEAEIEIDLRDHQIRSGHIANADIEIEGHEGLAVESQAIVDRPVDELPDSVKLDNPLVDRTRKTATVVYRMVNGKAACTAVKRGPSDDTHSLVLQGLDENDVVVVGPFKVLEKIKHDEAVVEDNGSATTQPSADSPVR